jgi:flagellar operon protein
MNKHKTAQGDTPLVFSSHSQQRMFKRGVVFTQIQLDRLHSALKILAGKGGKTAMVMLDETALVVSIKDWKVVTVIDRCGLREQAFTNIDSAIFA